MASRGRDVWYLSLELPIDGQANHTHIMGIVNGLTRRGWRTKLWHPRWRPQRPPWIRMLDWLTLQARMIATPRWPAVLYIRAHFACLPAVVWARIRHVPVVLEINGPDTDVLSSWPWARPLLPVFRLLSHASLRLCAAAIGVTPEIARSALREGVSRSFVVTNGADTELFSPDAVTDRDLPTRYACFVGTLATWQGIDHTLDSLGRPEWPPDVSLVVVGEGVEVERVRSLAAESPRLKYLGRLPHAAVAGVLAHALVALSPKSDSSHATSGVVPLKLFEAMACGVPVIVTDLPGQADIVRENDCGIVIPPRDPIAIGAAVRRISEDEERRREMGRNSRAAAVARYSWDAAAAKTERVLSAVLS
jgi:glycosyltransferase involved in cell wall biosynthesis